LRAELIKKLGNVDMKAFSRHVRERWLSEEALKQGYTLEDVNGFIRWLSDRMEFDL
jgi:hypothetical protein